MKIEFTLDWNPFGTNDDLHFFLSGIIWNEFQSVLEDFSYENKKVSFTYKKIDSKSLDFDKKNFREECGKRNVRTTYGIDVTKV